MSADEPEQPPRSVPYSTVWKPQYGSDAEFHARELAAAERRRSGVANLAIGAALFGVGLLVTVGTYGSASSSGGTYIVAWGPMVFGVIRIVRGLAKLGSTG